MKYQFDEYKQDDDDVFAFEPEAQNVELKYIPNNAIPVNIAHLRWVVGYLLIAVNLYTILRLSVKSVISLLVASTPVGPSL